MKWFNNMKISKRIIISFLFVTLISVVVGVLGIYNIKSINTSGDNLYTNNLKPLDLVNSIMEEFYKSKVNVRDELIDTNPINDDNYEKAVKTSQAEVEKYLTQYANEISSNEEHTIYDQLKNSLDKYNQGLPKVIELIKANKKDEAFITMQNELSTITADTDVAITKIFQFNTDQAKKDNETNNATANSSTVIMIGFILVGAILSIIIGLLISRSISKPVNKLVEVANRLAEGDLDVNIDVTTKDEIGILMNSLRNVIASLNEVMGEINNASTQVASGSRQVSDSAQALSQGSTEQASAIEELTASMEEISTQTNQNAANATQANELALAATEDAIKGNEQMKGMLKAMDDINEGSSNIFKIIKVIDEIAFQTNILALNAAVEAARAGQHGKGFAVVAEEVRNLAARSANAAKETTGLIEGSMKKVEGGTKIANNTAVALSKIVEGVTKVTNLVGEIATASNEQASGINQVNQGILQVSDVVQTNSATSEESAAASEELSSQAELLREQVSRFKLKKTTESSYKGFEDLNPEVLRMLEEMSNKKKGSAYPCSTQGYAEAAATSSKTKISLSNDEFGKY